MIQCQDTTWTAQMPALVEAYLNWKHGTDLIPENDEMFSIDVITLDSWYLTPFILGPAHISCHYSILQRSILLPHCWQFIPQCNTASPWPPLIQSSCPLFCHCPTGVRDVLLTEIVQPSPDYPGMGTCPV